MGRRRRRPHCKRSTGSARAESEETAQKTLLVLEQASSGNPSETGFGELTLAQGAEGELASPVVIQEDFVGLGPEDTNKSPAREDLTIEEETDICYPDIGDWVEER